VDDHYRWRPISAVDLQDKILAVAWRRSVVRTAVCLALFEHLLRKLKVERSARLEPSLAQRSKQLLQNQPPWRVNSHTGSHPQPLQ
jgi:hypothetical protein